MGDLVLMLKNTLGIKYRCVMSFPACKFQAHDLLQMRMRCRGWADECPEKRCLTL
jgi:hypothetical protein